MRCAQRQVVELIGTLELFPFRFILGDDRRRAPCSPIAQLVEHWSYEPCVTGSIPVGRSCSLFTLIMMVVVVPCIPTHRVFFRATVKLRKHKVINNTRSGSSAPYVFCVYYCIHPSMTQNLPACLSMWLHHTRLKFFDYCLHEHEDVVVVYPTTKSKPFLLHHRKRSCELQ